MPEIKNWRLIPSTSNEDPESSQSTFTSYEDGLVQTTILEITNIEAQDTQGFNFSVPGSAHQHQTSVKTCSQDSFNNDSLTMNLDFFDLSTI